MFTGLIEARGQIAEIINTSSSSTNATNDTSIVHQATDPVCSNDGNSLTFKIQIISTQQNINDPAHQKISSTPDSKATRAVEGISTSLKIGDSIAIDGICLTVAFLEINRADEPCYFGVNCSPETLRVTTFRQLKIGDQVNLERSLSSSSNTRLDGHVVQGHVDTTASIKSITPDSDSLRLEFQLFNNPASNAVDVPPSNCQEIPLINYLIPKGYVAIDGISLTINSITPQLSSFSINLIPHTQSVVTLGSRKTVGARVNVEFDIMVKTIVSSVERCFMSRIESVIEGILERRGLTGSS